MSRVVLLLLCTFPLGALAQEAPADDPHTRVQGVTISCQTWGWEWGSDAMVETLGEVRGVGANWIAIHPYARISADGTVRARRMEASEAPAWLTRPIAEAHARGLKVLIKPHLAYWGSPFSWRGEIAFETDAEWARFWSGYRAWILNLVDACKDADAFAVGTELDKTLAHTDRWRALIRDVRQRTQAPLTYAANWTDYQRVGFWRDLDVIGIQAYFPLVAHERPPTDAELARGWKRILGEVTTYARRQERKVLFSELGYDVSPLAARKPWESGQRRRVPDRDAAADLQSRCMRVALKELDGHPEVMGAFLWKWFPGASRGEDFLLSTPEMQRTIRSVWKSP